MKKLIVVLLAVALLLSTTGIAVAETGGKLVLYNSNATDWSGPIIQEFEERTGIQVETVDAGTGELVSRIQAERANTQADVLWGGVPTSYMAIYDMLEPYESTEIGALPANCVDVNHKYYGTDAVISTILYNTEIVSEEDAPTGWKDLVDPKWKGQIANADPTASSSSLANMMGIIFCYGKDEGGYDMIEKFVENLDGKSISSSSGVLKGVAGGEYALGLTYDMAAIQYVESGASVNWVYPEEGAVLMLTTMAIIADGKNTENAKLFLDFVLSYDVQSQLSSYTRRAVRLDVDAGEGMPKLDEITFVDYDDQWAADNKADFVEKWMDFVADYGA